jgi:glucose/arabinose dehydrogenase
MAARAPVLALAVAFLMAAFASGCGDEDDPPATTPASPPADEPADGGPRGGDIAVGDGRGGVRAAEIGVFDQPVYVAQPPGERDDLYVVEKTGRIVLVREGEALPEPFLDVSGEVSTGYEQGLLSMAFAPGYERSGRFYVDYTDIEGHSRIVEYRRSSSDPDAADPATARELLFVEQPFPNHNGGQLQFGPEGLLYVGFGDGGGSADPMQNGQRLDTLLGKILRIDPRPSGGEGYSIPATNPFADDPDALPEIYSYGLRNPWRFSFDLETGALAIGDVGQSAIEEIDLVARGEGAGANFGWSAFEGTQPFDDSQDAPGHVPPVLDYALAGGACAVTGGYVVRDRRLRSLYGRYVYADFCVGELRSFPADPGREATDDRALGVRIPQLSSFGEDAGGRIYVTSLDGPVYRLEPVG